MYWLHCTTTFLHGGGLREQLSFGCWVQAAPAGRSFYKLIFAISNKSWSSFLSMVAGSHTVFVLLSFSRLWTHVPYFRIIIIVGGVGAGFPRRSQNVIDQAAKFCCRYSHVCSSRVSNDLDQKKARQLNPTLDVVIYPNQLDFCSAQNTRIEYNDSIINTLEKLEQGRI